jgi:hypothetical protein
MAMTLTSTAIIHQLTGMTQILVSMKMRPTKRVLVFPPTTKTYARVSMGLTSVSNTMMNITAMSRTMKMNLINMTEPKASYMTSRPYSSK